MSTNLQININARDNASQTIAAAGKNITSSMRTVEQAGKNVALTNQNVDASSRQMANTLSFSERAQLANAQGALQLRQAQEILNQKQLALNNAIREYSANSEQAAMALRDLNSAQATVDSMQKQLSGSVRQTSANMKELTLGLSGAATAGISYYNIYDRVGTIQLAVNRANLQLSSSNKTLEDAQKKVGYAATDVEQAQKAVQAALTKSSAESDAYQNAVIRLSEAQQRYESATSNVTVAQERQSVATQQVEEYQGNLNEAIWQGAIMVIPTSITMVDSLSRAWKNFPNMHGVLTLLNTDLTTTTITAQMAVITVGALVAGLTLGYTAISQFGEALGPYGRALMVIIPLVVTLASAVWMLYSGLTLGGALIALAATGVAIGAMVANLQSYGDIGGQGPKIGGMATGGVANHPILTWVGEGKETEIISPVPLMRETFIDAINENTSAIGGVPPVIIQFNGDVYGMDDFERRVGKAADKAVMTKVRRRQ
jgi:exonuclease VII small subunit